MDDQRPQGWDQEDGVMERLRKMSAAAEPDVLRDDIPGIGAGKLDPSV